MEKVVGDWSLRDQVVQGVDGSMCMKLPGRPAPINAALAMTETLTENAQLAVTGVVCMFEDYCEVKVIAMGVVEYTVGVDYSRDDEHVLVCVKFVRHVLEGVVGCGCEG